MMQFRNVRTGKLLDVQPDTFRCVLAADSPDWELVVEDPTDPASVSIADEMAAMAAMTVAEALTMFEVASTDVVESMKAAEVAGKARTGILGWER